MSKYYFFFSHKNPFSNFYPCYIKHEGMTFFSAEQLFHYLKAELFNDEVAMGRILALSYTKEAMPIISQNEGFNINNIPQAKQASIQNDFVDLNKRAKALGKSVKGFNFDVWKEKRIEVMTKAVYSKLNCQKPILDQLAELQNKELVECSPYDRIWGIGYSSTQAMANVDNWGENLLGKVLMSLKEKLID